jgi:hypothetical protein
MPVANTSFSYDPDLDHDIHLVLSKLARRDRSAYLRSAIRFYEANKDRFEVDAMASQLGQVLELVKEIDRKLDQGVSGSGVEDGHGNDYLMKMAGQMDELFR